MDRMEPTGQSTSCINKRELDNGFTLIEFIGYTSYEDFMRIYEVIDQIVSPDTIRYSVDSLCIMGSFRKDGIIIRMSNDGISDYVSLTYNRDSLSDEEQSRVLHWARLVAEALS